MAKEMSFFLFFLVKRVGERGVGMAFSTGLMRYPGLCRLNGAWARFIVMV